MSAAGNSHFDVGRVVSRTFSVIGRNWLTFLLLSVLSVIPLQLWTYFFTQGAAAGGPAYMLSPGFVLSAIGGWIVTIVLGFVLQAALTYGTIMDLNGQRASLGEALGVGLRAFLPILAIGVLYTFGVMVGFLLLIVPGLMLFAAWAVVVPVRIAENAGIVQSFSRSGELTRGHRWAIFGMFIVFGVAVFILDMVTRPVFGLAVTANTAAAAVPPLYLVLTGAVRVVTAAVSAAGTACIYYELRTAKEGIGPQQLASVFE
jgi:hypothetical protein